MAAVIMLPGQTMTLSIKPVDANGNPVAIPAGATVSYSSNNSSAVTVTENADGQTAVAKAVATGPVDATATLGAVLNFSDGSGPKQFATPGLVVTVSFPLTAIASIALAETTPG
jgi:hypothetical protein